MKFVIAGASGFLGTAWRDHLAQEGHEVIRLVRRDAVSQNESRWDPYGGVVDRDIIEQADVVANLGGAPIVHWPFTESYQQKFRDSRMVTTRMLADAITKSDRKPAFLAQNGTSFYGDRPGEVLTEQSAAGTTETFLGEISKAWQAAATPAVEAGVRVCVMRTSVVLSKDGGAFRPLHLIFKAGLGGPAGNGQQYFATISLADWVRGATFLGTNESSEGVYNLTGPNPTTNEEFTKQLGRMLHRPTRLRVPGIPLRRVFPELAPELLSSSRVEPAKLLADGFEFEHPTIDERLAAALTR